MDDCVNLLMFLVDDYNLSFSAQTFENTPFGNWTTKTYSFYNDTGCFTISYLPNREEWEFYFSHAFSRDCAKLQKEILNVWIDEPEIWHRHQRWIFGLKDPFFWWKKKKVFRALSETIRKKIQMDNAFWGVKVE